MITSPTLLLDREKCLANITRMVNKADTHHVRLKPHFKTHQSAEIAEWFRERGISAAVVSSVKMAAYFAGHGWDDLTIGFPANIREIERLNRLAADINLSLFIIDPVVAEALNQQLSSPVGVYIEIDTGSNRTGLKPEETERIDALIEKFGASDRLNFMGFYSHPGHTYSARSRDQIERIHHAVLEDLAGLRARYGASERLRCCIGDTPSSSTMSRFEGVDEISPGNFVFYDLMQAQIGACDVSDIAVALASPVVAKHPSRVEIIIHGGAVHLSKESLEQGNRRHFGVPVRLQDEGWSEPIPGSYLRAISQEHGVLACNRKLFESIEIGDLIGILPVHSCLTADLMAGYTVSGTGRKIDHLKQA